MSDKLSKLGSYELEELSISNHLGKKISIRPQLLQLEIFEGIFDKFISGSLILVDAQNINSMLPFVGNEYLEITVSTPSIDRKISSSFFIYRMSEKYKLDKEFVYQLEFISFEAISSKNQRISKAFKGDPYQMMSYILSDQCIASEKQFFYEPPRNRFYYISNFWDGIKNIDYICDHSVSQNNSPTYLFYETLYGFHFNSLDYLISSDNKVSFDFTMSEYEKRMGNSTVKESTIRDYFQVQSVLIESGFDFNERVDSGFYGGRILSFDPITGRYYEKQISIDTKNKLNEFDCVDKNFVPTTTRTLMSFSEKSFNNFENSSDNTDTEYSILRSGIFSRLRNQNITIKVFGRFDYCVGMKVSLNVTNAGQSQMSSETLDKLLSGNFIITSVKHELTKNEHFSYLKLSKGTYIEDISK